MKLLYGLYTLGLLIISFSSSCEKENIDKCGSPLIKTIENFKIFKHSSGAVIYRAKFAIDADGSPRAYGPNNIGLDINENAINEGKWVGVVIGNDGKPILQKQGDPYPNYYVSQTSLYDSKYEITDPRRYVDAEKIPYVVLPESFYVEIGASLGDIAYVFNTNTQKGSYAILADEGPEGLLGEGSIYLAKSIGIPNISPRDGGLTDASIQYIIFPKSGIGNGKHRTIAEIEQEGQKQVSKLGNVNTILTCF